MKIIDISWPISSKMTTYKDKNDMQFHSVRSFEVDGVRESLLEINAHTGTHVDAPSHFLKDGKTIDEIPLTNLIGPCRVFDMTHIKEAISAADLKNCDFSSISIALFKTANSNLSATDKFSSNFIYLDASAAQYCVEQNIKAVGLDYLGIERNQLNHETHKVLLNANVAIIEGLRLQHVNQGIYYLICLPMALVGLEAAPARAVLIDALMPEY